MTDDKRDGFMEAAADKARELFSGSGEKQAGEVRVGGQTTSDRYRDDVHYAAARTQHLDAFDRDYDDYRREHQATPTNDFAGGDFGAWRTHRQSRQDAIAGIREHMEVVGDDGVHVGAVDKMRGDQIILTRTDPAAGGVHHAIPTSWIQGVGEKVMLNRHGEAARAQWQSAEAQSGTGGDENSRALGESPSQGSDGPHILDRSFAGTYDK